MRTFLTCCLYKQRSPTVDSKFTLSKFAHQNILNEKVLIKGEDNYSLNKSHIWKLLDDRTDASPYGEIQLELSRATSGRKMANVLDSRSLIPRSRPSTDTMDMDCWCRLTRMKWLCNVSFVSYRLAAFRKPMKNNFVSLIIIQLVLQ